MRFEDLVARSGDSQLINYNFSKEILTIHLEIEELDGSYLISILTEIVRGEQLTFNNDVLRTCRLELIELSKVLSVKNNFYIPNSNFGKIMQEVRNGLFLAYGRKNLDVKWVLNVTGYSCLLSCLINDLDKVQWCLKD
jgi:hypothetical protein